MEEDQARTHRLPKEGTLPSRNNIVLHANSNAMSLEKYCNSNNSPNMTQQITAECGNSYLQSKTGLYEDPNSNSQPLIDSRQNSFYPYEEPFNFNQFVCRESVGVDAEIIYRNSCDNEQELRTSLEDSRSYRNGNYFPSRSFVCDTELHNQNNIVNNLSDSFRSSPSDISPSGLECNEETVLSAVFSPSPDISFNCDSPQISAFCSDANVAKRAFNNNSVFEYVNPMSDQEHQAQNAVLLIGRSESCTRVRLKDKGIQNIPVVGRVAAPFSDDTMEIETQIMEVEVNESDSDPDEPPEHQPENNNQAESVVESPAENPTSPPDTGNATELSTSKGHSSKTESSESKENTAVAEEQSENNVVEKEKVVLESQTIEQPTCESQKLSDNQALEVVAEISELVTEQQRDNYEEENKITKTEVEGTAENGSTEKQAVEISDVVLEETTNDDIPAEECASKDNDVLTDEKTEEGSQIESNKIAKTTEQVIELGSESTGACDSVTEPEGEKHSESLESTVNENLTEQIKPECDDEEHGKETKKMVEIKETTSDDETGEEKTSIDEKAGKSDDGETNDQEAAEKSEEQNDLPKVEETTDDHTDGADKSKEEAEVTGKGTVKDSLPIADETEKVDESVAETDVTAEGSPGEDDSKEEIACDNQVEEDNFAHEGKGSDSHMEEGDRGIDGQEVCDAQDDEKNDDDEPEEAPETLTANGDQVSDTENKEGQSEEKCKSENEMEGKGTEISGQEDDAEEAKEPISSKLQSNGENSAEITKYDEKEIVKVDGTEEDNKKVSNDVIPDEDVKQTVEEEAPKEGDVEVVEKCEEGEREVEVVAEGSADLETTNEDDRDEEAKEENVGEVSEEGNVEEVVDESNVEEVVDESKAEETGKENNAEESIEESHVEEAAEESHVDEAVQESHVEETAIKNGASEAGDDITVEAARGDAEKADDGNAEEVDKGNATEADKGDAAEATAETEEGDAAEADAEVSGKGDTTEVKDDAVEVDEGDTAAAEQDDTIEGDAADVEKQDVAEDGKEETAENEEGDVAEDEERDAAENEEGDVAEDEGRDAAETAAGDAENVEVNEEVWKQIDTAELLESRVDSDDEEKNEDLKDEDQDDACEKKSGKNDHSQAECEADTAVEVNSEAAVVEAVIDSKPPISDVNETVKPPKKTLLKKHSETKESSSVGSKTKHVQLSSAKTDHENETDDVETAVESVLPEEITDDSDEVIEDIVESKVMSDAESSLKVADDTDHSEKMEHVIRMGSKTSEDSQPENAAEDEIETQEAGENPPVDTKDDEKGGVKEPDPNVPGGSQQKEVESPGTACGTSEPKPSEGQKPLGATPRRKRKRKATSRARSLSKKDGSTSAAGKAQAQKKSASASSSGAVSKKAAASKNDTQPPARTSSADSKKVPPIKAPVGFAPPPKTKNVKSKIGSLDNIKHKPKGGDKKVESVKLEWSTGSKVGSLDNATHKAGGGDKKILTQKLEFREKGAARVGSKDNIKHKPGGGTVKVETQKLDFKEKASSRVGSMDNVKHRPGGGNIKISDKLQYKDRANAGSGSEKGSTHGSETQSPVPPLSPAPAEAKAPASKNGAAASAQNGVSSSNASPEKPSLDNASNQCS